ncbi:hypothetical protein E8E13_006891 [Curvularia kusanoi]|uniref:Uncharacterized protein n=1 Tax=Curvularia kusanoi TaxID=90978 RepID=A0A9P4TDN6_CURKU|nr:hypothetical protein E8E13_006891 [Curvularia kusanoi]
MSSMGTKTNDAEEQVLALICGNDEPWTWGGDAHQCRITFDRNGTGALNCGENQRSWIAVEFNWSFSTKPVRAETGSWTIAIQMTLTTRIPSEYHKYNHWFEGAALQDHLERPPPASDAPFPWAPLRSDAFQPKFYTLTLSHGRFIEPFHYFIKPAYPLFQSGADRFVPNRFSHQLVFDKSPYPPRKEWVESYGNGDLKRSLSYHHYWERTDFVRGPISRKDQTWADTLDMGWWLSSSAGEGHVRSS